MATQTLGAQGAGTKVQIALNHLTPFPPGFTALVSGTLTYNIEATCNTPADGAESTWTWTPLLNFTGLTTSVDGCLTGLVTYLRPNVTAFTSGSLVFQVAQSQVSIPGAY